MLQPPDAQDNFLTRWLVRIWLPPSTKDISQEKVCGAHQPRYIFQMVGMRVVCNTQKAVLKKLMRNNDRGASTFLYINVHGLTRNIYLKNIADYLFNEY
jgi:hypothetical protein